jgi:hypothetical protein
MIKTRLHIEFTARLLLGLGFLFFPAHLNLFAHTGTVLDRPTNKVSVYVFPNPVKSGDVPVVRVETPAERVTTHIFDMSGDLVYQSKLEEISLAQDEIAFEQKLNLDLFRSGVYVGLVTAVTNEGVRYGRYQFTVVR